MADLNGVKKHFKQGINSTKVTEVKTALIQFNAFLILKAKELREVP